MNIPYERIVQWASGPVSILAGYLATLLVAHVGLLHQLGVGHSQVAGAIFGVGIFGVATAATYLGHAKWMANLVKWWETQSKKT